MAERFSVEPDGSTDAAIAAHEAAGNPHPTYLTQAEGDALYEDTGAAAAAIVAHESAGNPHPTYLTQAEGDALYEPMGGGGGGAPIGYWSWKGFGLAAFGTSRTQCPRAGTSVVASGSGLTVDDDVADGAEFTLSAGTWTLTVAWRGTGATTMVIYDTSVYSGNTIHAAATECFWPLGTETNSQGGSLTFTLSSTTTLYFLIGTNSGTPGRAGLPDSFFSCALSDGRRGFDC